MTDHDFETALSGRSKCRGCGLSIAKDSIRFGEHLPSPFGEGDMVHWHHPECAAHRRTEPLAATINNPEAVAEITSEIDVDALQAIADLPSLIPDCSGWVSWSGCPAGVPAVGTAESLSLRMLGA